MERGEQAGRRRVTVPCHYVPWVKETVYLAGEKNELFHRFLVALRSNSESKTFPVVQKGEKALDTFVSNQFQPNEPITIEGYYHKNRRSFWAFSVRRRGQ